MSAQTFRFFFALFALVSSWLGLSPSEAHAQSTGARYFEVAAGNNGITGKTVYVDSARHVKVSLTSVQFLPDPRGKSVSGKYRVILYRSKNGFDQEMANQVFSSSRVASNTGFSVSRSVGAYYYVKIVGADGFGRTVGYVTVSGSNNP